MKKITLNEFWNVSELCAIHCDTEEKAVKLLTAFNKMGKKWCNNESYLEKNEWGAYKKETCYSNEGLYCHKAFYLDMNYKVYEFEEVELVGRTMNDSRKAKPYEELPVLFCEDGFEPTIPLPDVEKEIKYVDQLINETAALAKEGEMYKDAYIDCTNYIQAKNKLIEEMKDENNLKVHRIVRLQQEKIEAERIAAERKAEEEKKRVDERMRTANEAYSIAEKSNELASKRIVIWVLFIIVNILNLLINIAIIIVRSTRH